jgi:hypothetical protein
VVATPAVLTRSSERPLRTRRPDLVARRGLRRSLGGRRRPSRPRRTIRARIGRAIRRPDQTP